MALGPTGSVWLASNDGSAIAFDERAGKVVQSPVALHSRKVNTLSVCCGRGHLLASAGSDNLVRVWDLRQLGAKAKGVAVHELPHSKSTQAAEWSPDGSSSLLTTCYDDRLRIFDGIHSAAPTERHAIKHCCQTGRWVVPFRATWSPAGDGVVVGGLRRTAELYAAAGGGRLGALSSELMTAIPSRNTCHPSGRAVACATNSGRIHVYR